MKLTVNCSEFIEAFRRADRAHHFTREGLVALFDYLEEMELDTGEEIELDVVGLCCDYTEYGYEDEEAALEWLRDRTHVIRHAKGVIVSNF